ncbi:MAG: sensor histidine kinase, partial [Bacteroidales bacterium]
SSLLDSMAHDLKTPLTAIRVAASNLQADWATADDHRTQSDIVLDEVARLSELFDHMLQMARIETKAVVPAAEWVTPGEIVDAALGEVRRQLSGRRLVVTSDDAHAVHVDPRLTSSALAHLVENAVQYSESGSTVTVSAAVAENGLTLSVDDEGPGLSKAEIGHVFDRYFRGRAGAARPAGAGMGLAVVRGLVEAQGGAVSATNREERGSRFTIRIPAASRTVPSSDDEP